MSPGDVDASSLWKVLAAIRGWKAVHAAKPQKRAAAPSADEFEAAKARWG